MSDLLSIGASGVRAYQTALGTVSENIANAGNAGYARRDVALGELAATGGGLTANRIDTGYGVSVDGIMRAADAFKSAAVRSAGADLARTETGAVWLNAIQDALTGNELGARLTGFFNAATTLAADPTSIPARAVLLEAGNAVAQGFAATGAALDQASATLDATADQAATTLGALATALAKINEGLGRTAPGTSAQAALLDQRDSILEQASALIDTDARFDPAGRATLRIGGSGGPVLVAGTEAGAVTLTRNDEGAIAFTVRRGGTIASLSPAGGALAGIVDGAAKIADARAVLTQVATDFVDGVNTIQAQGRDLAGNPGAAIFAVGSDPTAISVVLTDPSQIAAAAVGGGIRDAGNIAELAALRTGGGFEGRITTLVATNAATIASRKTVGEAQTAIRDGAISARDSVQGVDLDSEAVDLLRFQQAYQASSRIIQVARETLQSILDIN